VKVFFAFGAGIEATFAFVLAGQDDGRWLMLALNAVFLLVIAWREKKD
jgi:hypothetical protein